MYNEEELIQLSALQHLLFCERQCALIHIEQAWIENRFTAEGRILHEKVHDQGDEVRSDVRIVRALPLRSMRLGLSGIADVVEFHFVTEKDLWRPFPVEYKRGKPKAEACDTVQLCAQAICLEEMLGTDIPKGAIFYGKTRRRFDVELDASLRTLTAETAQRLHDLVRSGRTPPPSYNKRCELCSLFDVCMPKALRQRRSVAEYINGLVNED